MTTAGIILFYLAAANAVLALNIGTCTQGDASRLWGGLISLILYVIATLLLAQTKRPAFTLIALLPTLPVLAWQLIFTVRLATGHWIANSSACDILENTSGQSLDGSEPLFILIWTLLTLASGWSFRRAIAAARHHRLQT